MSFATKNIAILPVLALLACFGLSTPAVANMIDADKSSAVIFAYQRIGDDSVPQGSLALEQFKNQVQQLKSDGYTVWPLKDVIEKIQKGEEIPPRTVVLTFDGAWTGTMKTVVPILQEAKFPFTIFITSDVVDQQNPQHATWADLKSLKKNKLASFGIFPSGYSHLVNATPEENASLINKAVSRFREELGEAPIFFAYPYGEYSTAVKNALKPYHFTAAFGQQSGVVHSKSDVMALPRFTMTDSFGDFDRFVLTANALPLPVSDVTPDNAMIKENPPQIGFTVTSGLKDLSRLSCFVSGHGKVSIQKPGGNRVELRMAEPFEDRSTRINCTMPESSYIPGHGTSAWRWFGMQVVNPDLAEQNLDDSAPEEDVSSND